MANITFSANQIAQSNSISKNDITITQAKITSVETSGDFQYFMNADGQTHTDKNGVLRSKTVTTLDAVGANITQVAGKVGNCLNFPGEIPIVDSRTGSEQLTFGSVTSIQKIAQSFVATGCGLINNIRIKRRTRLGTPTGNIIVKICADSSGSPGTSLASKTITATDFNGLGINESFITVTYSGVAGTTYWLTFEQSVNSDTAHEYLNYDSTASIGVLKSYNGSWSTVGGSLYFSVNCLCGMV